MNEKGTVRKSRLEHQKIRKDARAEKLIRGFAAKLRSIAGKDPIPDKWRKLTVEELSMESLSGFMARYMAPKETIKRKRGRPPSFSEENKTSISMDFELQKARLSENQRKPLTDRAVIRYSLKEDDPSISDRELRRRTEVLAKQVSRFRPRDKRRLKKKSQKLRQ